MKNKIYFSLIFWQLVVVVKVSLGQTYCPDNFVKITKSYLEFRMNKSVNKFPKDKYILLIGANSVGKDSLWFEVYLVNRYTLSKLKYSKVYQFDSFKLVIMENLNKSDILKGLFKETSYEDFNNAKIHVDAEYITWHITLDKNYRILSVESKYNIDDLLVVLRRNKVRFSNLFKRIKNLPY